MEEVQVIALLADNSHLIATAEADKAFWLLTDERLRAMYSGARQGKSFSDLALELLPTPTAEYVLSGTYRDHKDALKALASQVQGLESRKTQLDHRTLSRSMSDAQRSGNRDKARLLAQLAQAERQGDSQLAARLRDSLTEHGTETVTDADSPQGNRKQVD
jgi:hypothetical protein